MSQYTVYVGGDEVNDYYLTKEKAKDLAEEYIDDGYDDVVIQLVEEWDMSEEDRCIEIIEERNMLADENKKFAEFLSSLGYNLDSIGEIARVGAKFEEEDEWIYLHWVVVPVRVQKCNVISIL